MARGWESKGVESQIEEQFDTGERKRSLTPAEMERERQRSSLELSRRRIVKELETAKTPVHRTALEHALAHLDGELSRLK